MLTSFAQQAWTCTVAATFSASTSTSGVGSADLWAEVNARSATHTLYPAISRYVNPPKTTGPSTSFSSSFWSNSPGPGTYVPTTADGGSSSLNVASHSRSSHSSRPSRSPRAARCSSGATTAATRAGIPRSTVSRHPAGRALSAAHAMRDADLSSPRLSANATLSVLSRGHTGASGRLLPSGCWSTLTTRWARGPARSSEVRCGNARKKSGCPLGVWVAQF
ncbi:uncharacterized protein BXZ73DRAFT_83122 [Epithele typhae]|uniref:uncharacterized protein n=1 Tax=Epithele typhae TaxID=378194 RepID=UPI002008AE75|nr:uncharacterized protein BXZ73DRAFT_83122 [Epithele typhae]KAH9910836.1 hypothetical protein BXZ73DRAFT_83122 [Epithele typhae]